MVDYAVERGNTGDLLALVSSGPNLDTLDDFGTSALELEVMGGAANVSHEQESRTNSPL